MTNFCSLYKYLSHTVIKIAIAQPVAVINASVITLKITLTQMQKYAYDVNCLLIVNRLAKWI